MTGIFLKIAGMSISACVVIAAVCLVRLALLRCPRKFSYVLWLAVLIRLLCPFTFTAQVRVEPEQLDRELVAIWAEYAAQAEASGDEIRQTDGTVQKSFATEAVFGIIWLAGILAMAVYCARSLWKLRSNLTAAVPLANNIYIADHIGAPFVVGLLRPKIYIPSDLGEDEREYILAHELHHIRRGDHFVKLLAFAALTLHWFNPLVWMAFRLFVKDMEASCDEAVLSKLGEKVRSDYSQSLLNLAIGRKMPAWTPLAFGEDTKGRIENVLRWRRPSLTRVVAAALVTAACIGCCFVSVEGVLVQEQQNTEAAGVPDLDIGEIKSGIIVRTPDPKGYEELTEGQVETLSELLKRIQSTQFGAKAEDFESSFVITLWDEEKRDVSIRLGHEGGERCVTVNGYIVRSELLAAGAYHIYLSFGTQNLCDESLPDGAVLLGEHHGVYIYEFYCPSCGQTETASIGHGCDCCNWSSNGERFERLSTPGGDHR